MLDYVPPTTLHALWRANWGDAPPIGYELKHWFRPRWARFHVEDLSELSRHSVVVEEMMTTGRLLVIAQELEPGDLVHGWLREAIPDARLWTSVPSDGGERHSTVWVSPLLENSARLHPLLELVADDATGSVIIADESLTWLYHPYDSGGDLIAPTIGHRNELARLHPGWLSPRVDGL